MTEISNIRARLPALLAFLILPAAIFFTVQPALADDSSGVSETRALSEGFAGVPMSQLEGYERAKESASASDSTRIAAITTCCCCVFKNNPCEFIEAALCVKVTGPEGNRVVHDRCKADPVTYCGPHFPPSP